MMKEEFSGLAHRQTIQELGSYMRTISLEDLGPSSYHLNRDVPQMKCQPVDFLSYLTPAVFYTIGTAAQLPVEQKA
jgi:hypothetical protein